MSFSVIVDSCCDLTPEQRGTGLYTSIPLTIHVGGTEFRDDDQLDTQLLSDAIALCGEAAHTSCPAPADYLAVYEAAQGVGRFYYIAYSAACLPGRTLLTRRLDHTCASILTYQSAEPFGEYETVCLRTLKEDGHGAAE